MAAGCNGNGGDKSVQVTAEQWSEAFSKTSNATNFTVKRTGSVKTSDNSDTVDEEYIAQVSVNCFSAEYKYKRVFNGETEEGADKVYGEKDNNRLFNASFIEENEWSVRAEQPNVMYIARVYGVNAVVY